MATRDPETGRFVSGPGGPDMAYSDLDVQHVLATLDDPDNSHTDQLEVSENVLAFEPLGGLARSEIAELVAAKWVFHGGFSRGTDGANSMEIACEVSFDSTEALLDFLADDVDETDFITGIDRRVTELVDIDILFHDRGTFGGATNNNTDGVGMGYDQHHHSEWVPYRARFGRGPVVDRHDELHVHLAYNESVATAAFEFGLYGMLVWDVSEG